MAVDTVFKTAAVAANTTTANVLAGESIEFPRMRAALEILATGSAAGMLMYLQIGSRVVMDYQGIPGTNRYPFAPDDLVLQAAAAAGERIILKFQNPTGGALTYQVKAFLQPI